MAASVVGVARTPSDGSDATGASLALTIPAGTAVDDYALIIIELWDSTTTNPTLTYPSGFTEFVNYVSTTDGFEKLKIARKKLTAADSGTYPVSGFASHFRQGHVAILRGIDGTTPLDVAVNLQQNASGTALPANSVTTVTDGCLLVHVIVNENSCTGTPSTGYTEQADSNYTKTNTKLQATAGTDTPSGGSFSTSTLKLGALMAFRPAASGSTPVSGTDSGTVSDSSALQRASGVTDSGTVADTSAIQATGSASDPANVTDTSAVSTQATASDAATFTDSSALTILLTVSDVGAASETSAASVATAATDAATFGDVSSLNSGGTPGASDQGTLTDAASTAATTAASDSGSLTDASGVSTTVTVADASTLTDLSALANSLPTVDTGSLADTAALQRAADLTDTASIAESVSIQVTTATGDTSSLLDLVLAGSGFAVSDTASLNELAVVGAAGAITYRPYAGRTPRTADGITPRPDDGITERL